VVARFVSRSARRHRPVPAPVARHHGGHHAAQAGRTATEPRPAPLPAGRRTPTAAAVREPFGQRRQVP
jgi:hypothetical protein